MESNASNPFYQDPSYEADYLVEEIASDIAIAWEWSWFHPTDADAAVHLIAYYRFYGNQSKKIDLKRLARVYNSSATRIKVMLGEILSWHGEPVIPEKLRELLARVSQVLP
jgi:hypothetical protein